MPKGLNNTFELSKKNLLDLLYNERQRCAERSNSSGWSIWAIVVSNITLLWKVLERLAEDSTTPPPTPPRINWDETACICLGFVVSAFSVKALTLLHDIKFHKFSLNSRVKNTGMIKDLDSYILLGLMSIFTIWAVWADFYKNIPIAPFPIVLFLLFAFAMLYYFLDKFNTIASYGYMVTAAEYKDFRLGDRWSEYNFYIAFVGFFLLGIGLPFYNFSWFSIQFGLLIFGVVSLTYLTIWMFSNEAKIRLDQIDELINRCLLIPECTETSKDINLIYEELQMIVAGPTTRGLITRRIDELYEKYEKSHNLHSVSEKDSLVPKPVRYLWAPMYYVAIKLYLKFVIKDLKTQITDFSERIKHTNYDKNSDDLTRLKSLLRIM